MLKVQEDNSKYAVTNSTAKWRLGARDIQELPLLAAYSQMEITPIACKSRKPSCDSSSRNGRQAPIKVTELTEERGREGRGECLNTWSHAKSMLTENAISMNAANMSPIRSTWNPGACTYMYPHTTDQLQEYWCSLLFGKTNDCTITVIHWIVSSILWTIGARCLITTTIKKFVLLQSGNLQTCTN